MTCATCVSLFVGLTYISHGQLHPQPSTSLDLKSHKYYRKANGTHLAFNKLRYTLLTTTLVLTWLVLAANAKELSYGNTAVRLKLEQNQLVDVFDEISILFDALKGA